MITHSNSLLTLLIIIINKHNTTNDTNHNYYYYCITMTMEGRHRHERQGGGRVDAAAPVGGDPAGWPAAADVGCPSWLAGPRLTPIVLHCTAVARIRRGLLPVAARAMTWHEARPPPDFISRAYDLPVLPAAPSLCWLRGLCCTVVVWRRCVLRLSRLHTEISFREDRWGQDLLANRSLLAGTAASSQGLCSNLDSLKSSHQGQNS